MTTYTNHMITAYLIISRKFIREQIIGIPSQIYLFHLIPHNNEEKVETGRLACRQCALTCAHCIWITSIRRLQLLQKKNSNLYNNYDDKLT